MYHKIHLKIIRVGQDKPSLLSIVFCIQWFIIELKINKYITVTYCRLTPQ